MKTPKIHIYAADNTTYCGQPAHNRPTTGKASDWHLATCESCRRFASVKRGGVWVSGPLYEDKASATAKSDRIGIISAADHCARLLVHAAYPGITCSRKPAFVDKDGRGWCTYHSKQISDGLRATLRLSTR
jgi:hypothetical protein